MTLFNGLKTILLVATYLERTLPDLAACIFFNPYVWLVRTIVLYDVCYTLFSSRHLHPYAIYLYINLNLRFNQQTNSLPISDLSLIHLAKLPLLSLTAGHAFLPKVKLTRMDLFSLRYSSPASQLYCLIGLVRFLWLPMRCRRMQELRYICKRRCDHFFYKSINCHTIQRFNN